MTDRKPYFHALAQELCALKDRVRQLKRNWQADGEWKESVLRTILRRHLPTDVSVSRGFVVAAGGRESGQLDILIHRNSRPVLFRDGDLVIVTPDAVCGIIEVKTTVSQAQFREAAKKLATDIAIVRKHPHRPMMETHNAFAGLFSYGYDDADVGPIVQAVGDVAADYAHRINFAAVGTNGFVRYWDVNPKLMGESDRSYRGGHYNSWHGYELPDMAAGYFIHNVVEAVCPDSVLSNNEVWFPLEDKESSLKCELRAKWHGDLLA